MQPDMRRYDSLSALLGALYRVPRERFQLAQISLEELTSGPKQARPRYHPSSATTPPDECILEPEEAM
jgi:hypothetical protein